MYSAAGLYGGWGQGRERAEDTPVAEEACVSLMLPLLR